MTAELVARMAAPGPKKVLALDGGGIRGLITIQVLGRIERMLRHELNAPGLVLSDYFDFVAGASTGAILAACIAQGMPVEKIRRFYIESAPAMFDKATIAKQFRHGYQDAALASRLQREFGADAVLGGSQLKTLLMMVMRNATTDAPWLISNNPSAKYNLRDDDDVAAVTQRDLPLWQLVRASTAAPTYCPPELVKLSGQDFLFLDGGSTIYNNPAFQAFLMATVEPYAVDWRAAEDQLLVVSVGTGASPRANENLAPGDSNLLYEAGSIPSALMFAAMNEQDMLCRIFGRCRLGDPIDREVGDLHFAKGPTGADRMFSYVRYNVELSSDGLERVGLKFVKPEQVQQLHALTHLDALTAVGDALGTSVAPEHFAKFL